VEHYRELIHAVYDLKYHLVWISKYRKPILMGEVATRARAYFVASPGNVTDEVIVKHIEDQSLEPPDDAFKVEGEL
jgi:putative transposase